MRRMMLGLGTVLLTATMGLAACGDDDDDATSGTGVTDPTGSTGSSDTGSSVGVSSTAFNTLPPPSTTSPPTTTQPLQPGEIIETESTYTIVAGDFPSTVASKFKVDMAEMLELNGLELVGNQVPGWPLPGNVIKIPAGATVPGAPSTPSTAAAGDAPTGTGDGADEGDADAAPTTVDVCAPSTYEIQAGDAKVTVAAKFDTTVEALDAANVDTPSYDAFIVGFDIVIPAKTDC